jgi:hypothetical protein
MKSSALSTSIRFFYSSKRQSFGIKSTAKSILLSPTPTAILIRKMESRTATQMSMAIVNSFSIQDLWFSVKRPIRTAT